MPSFFLLIPATTAGGRVDSALVTPDGAELKRFSGANQFEVKNQATQYLRTLRTGGALGGEIRLTPRLVPTLADRSWLAGSRLEAENAELRGRQQRIEAAVRRMPTGPFRTELLEILDPTFTLPTAPGSIITARQAGAGASEEFHLRRDGLWMSRFGVCSKEDILSSKFTDRRVVKAA